MRTAVEWLVEKFMTENTTKEGWQEIFEQAKEMEKEQMVQSYANGQADSLSLIKNMKDIPAEFNQMISDNFNDLV
jgi:hypothetical protein